MEWKNNQVIEKTGRIPKKTVRIQSSNFKRL